MPLHALPVAGVLKISAAVTAGFFFWRRSRRRPESEPDEVEEELSAEAAALDLDVAERAVSRSIDEQRASLEIDHVLCARLSTFSGVTSLDVESLVGRLEKDGILVYVLFDAALSPRAGKTMRPQGYFEIYVRKGDTDRVSRALREWESAAD